MNEEEIGASLGIYREQLSQVELALQAAGEDGNADLVKLRTDLIELIKLTEDSLLSLKKSKLLSMLDSDNSSSLATKPTVATSSHSDRPDLDAEFAAFQESLAGETSSTGTSQGATPASTNQNSPQTSSGDLDPTEDDLADISGTKCRAPFSHDWGEKQYHNAMVLQAEPLEAEAEPKVRVLFCNPTHKSLLPCPFFLEGRCKFDEDSCRFSHGHVVLVEELQEYMEPDYSELRVGSACLAKDTDNIWYKATVIEVMEGHRLQVMFDSTDSVLTVDLEDALPASGDASDADVAVERSMTLNDLDSDPEEDDILPVFLWRPQTTQSMGDWEVHTKGIGSKLMAQMGYIVGDGLGRDGKGRAEPVPIQLLPQGKSLDKIMELKALAGDRDLYDVLKKQKRKQRKMDAKAAKLKDQPKPKPSNVFDFINKKLGHKKGRVQDLVKTKHLPKTLAAGAKHIKEHDLKEKSDKDVNIQHLRTAEEMKNTQKEIARLKTAIARNEGSDKRMANQLKQKLASTESYLDQLQSSQSSIQRHMKSRSEHKKLTVF